MDKKIVLTNSELYIPSNTLPYGIYQFNLTVTMINYSNLKNSSSIYIQISPSGITANLVQLGTSVVTNRYEQNLTLNPGNYSIDPDRNQFNTTVFHFFSILKYSILYLGLELYLFLSNL